MPSTIRPAAEDSRRAMSAYCSYDEHLASEYSPERLGWTKSSKWTPEHRGSYVCPDPDRFVDLTGYEVPPEGWYQHEFICPWPGYWDKFIEEVEKESKFHGIKIKPVMGYIRKDEDLTVVFWGESKADHGMIEDMDSYDEQLNIPKHTLALMVAEESSGEITIASWSPMPLEGVLKGMRLCRSRYGYMDPVWFRPPQQVQVCTGDKSPWVESVAEYLGDDNCETICDAAASNQGDYHKKQSALQKILFPKLDRRVDIQGYDLSNLYWSTSLRIILPGQWDNFEWDIKQHDDFKGVDIRPVAGFTSHCDQRTVIFWGQASEPAKDGSYYTVALKVVQGQSVTSYTPMPLADVITAMSYADETERNNKLREVRIWKEDQNKFYTKVFKAPSHVRVSRGDGAVAVLEPVVVTEHKVVKCPIIFGEQIHIHQRPTEPNSISCVPDTHCHYPLQRSRLFSRHNPMHAMYEPRFHTSEAKADDPYNVDIRPCRTPKGWRRYQGRTSATEEYYRSQVQRKFGIDVKKVAFCSLDRAGGYATIYWGEKHRENQAPDSVALEHTSGSSHGQTKLFTPMPLKTLLDSMEEAYIDRDAEGANYYRLSLPGWVRTQSQVEGEPDRFEKVIKKTYDREQGHEGLSDLGAYFERVYSDSEGNGDEYVDSASESGVDDGSSTSSGGISSVPDSDVDIEELRFTGEIFEFEH